MYLFTGDWGIGMEDKSQVMIYNPFTSHQNKISISEGKQVYQKDGEVFAYPLTLIVNSKTFKKNIYISARLVCVSFWFTNTHISIQKYIYQMSKRNLVSRHYTLEIFEVYFMYKQEVRVP